MATEYYYYGQGRVYSRRFGVVGAKWRWWGDVSELTLSADVEKLQHRESYSGNKGIARDFPISKGLTMNATLHQLDTDQLADLVYGATSVVAAGVVVAEVLPTVAVGDIVKLAQPGVSALTIVDSTGGTPLPYGSGNYTLDARFGSLEILTLPAIVQPLKASYSHSGSKQVNMLTQPQPIIEFRYEGLNLAENNAAVIVELYKLSTDPLQELALINNGTELAGPGITCAVLIDPSKSATGPLGQFGRILQVNPLA